MQRKCNTPVRLQAEIYYGEFRGISTVIRENSQIDFEKPRATFYRTSPIAIRNRAFGKPDLGRITVRRKFLDFTQRPSLDLA